MSFASYWGAPCCRELGEEDEEDAGSGSDGEGDVGFSDLFEAIEEVRSTSERAEEKSAHPCRGEFSSFTLHTDLLQRLGG